MVQTLEQYTFVHRVLDRHARRILDNRCHADDRDDVILTPVSSPDDEVDDVTASMADRMRIGRFDPASKSTASKSASPPGGEFPRFAYPAAT